MSSPLFSILISNYNNGRYINNAINSVLKQTYSNWEIIIVDDCSADETRKVLSNYKNDSRIKFFFNDSNKGAGFTKKKCISLANGQYCGFLDSDDALLPNAIELLLESITKDNRCSVVFSTHYICDEKLNIIKMADYVGLPENGDFLIGNGYGKIVSHFVAFSRKAYLKTKGTYEDVEKAVDRDLYYLLEELGTMKFIDKPLYLYRHHSNNISLGGENNENIALAWDIIVKRRAIIRRIENVHPLFLKNEKIYCNLYLSYSKFIRTNTNVGESYIKIFKFYFKHTTLKNVSICRILLTLLPRKIFSEKHFSIILNKK